MRACVRACVPVLCDVDYFYFFFLSFFLSFFELDWRQVDFSTKLELFHFLAARFGRFCFGFPSCSLMSGVNPFVVQIV